MRQYEMFELSFKGGAPQNAEALASFTAEFAMGGKKTKSRGFYDGDGTYKVRYYPDAVGMCSWKVRGIPGMDMAKAQCIEGEEECVCPAEGHHGMVGADGVHFRYDDGRVFLPFGTTIYAMVHQERTLVEETRETLAHSPFNKVRFCVFPKHYDFNKNEPECFAFEKRGDGSFDFERPCYRFWALLEENLEVLGKMGIQADLILFHPYDCWGFAHMTREECKIYLDYLIRRLSAFPNVWWSLANEYDLMYSFETERWAEMAAYIGNHDAYHHLLSNHNFVTPWDFNDPNTTHCCLQSSDAVKIPHLQKKYGKPVVLDEMGYEGNIPYNWGNLSAFEMVSRFWKTCCYGGYATHGETCMEKMDDSQVLWWSKGGTLKGKSPERIRFLRELMESFPGPLDHYQPEQPYSFENQKELQKLIEMKVPGFWDNAVMRTISKMDDDSFGNIMEVLAQSVVHYKDEVYLQYFGDMCTIYAVMELPKENWYRLEIIDVWEMTRTEAYRCARGKTEVTLPGKPGIALLATKISSACL